MDIYGFYLVSVGLNSTEKNLTLPFPFFILTIVKCLEILLKHSV